MKRAVPTGFTLIETVVAMGLSVLLMLALASMITYFYKANTSTLLEWQAVSVGQGNLSRAMAQLRETPALVSAGDASISYNDASGILVTYAPTGASFTYYDASGTPLVEPIDTTQVRSVLVQVAVTAGGGAATTTLLSGAALLNLATTTP